MLIDIILGGLEQPPHVKLVYNNIRINNQYYIRKDAKGFFLDEISRYGQSLVYNFFCSIRIFQQKRRKQPQIASIISYFKLYISTRRIADSKYGAIYYKEQDSSGYYQKVKVDTYQCCVCNWTFLTSEVVLRSSMKESCLCRGHAISEAFC